MPRVIGIAGSLRKGSFNRALLRAAKELAPEGLEIDIAEIRDFPLYDADVEAAGMPEVVVALKERIASADGLLIATPEYNGSIPGVVKNAIDWMSRPAKDIARVFGDRAVGLIGASGGPGGTRLGQAAWLPVLRVLGARPFFGKSVYVASAAQSFDAEGKLTDEKLRGVVSGYVAAFAAFL
ncbi:MAG: NAD(P)H-dependent oxidoreductase [Deltaproteobacteria bacterium]|nr:NAD(P)H-dependent oxidoreductase [Deltaproteobacteria bacterium]